MAKQKKQKKQKTGDRSQETGDRSRKPVDESDDKVIEEKLDGGNILPGQLREDQVEQINEQFSGATGQAVDEQVDDKTDEQIDEQIDEKSAGAPAAIERGTKWHFPNASQCPRCRTHDTVATSTKGNKQYRQCRRGHCRYRYCVIGVERK